jgi:hypothetical protein
MVFMARLWKLRIWRYNETQHNGKKFQKIIRQNKFLKNKEKGKGNMTRGMCIKVPGVLLNKDFVDIKY